MASSSELFMGRLHGLLLIKGSKKKKKTKKKKKKKKRFGRRRRSDLEEEEEAIWIIISLNNWLVSLLNKSQVVTAEILHGLQDGGPRAKPKQ